MLTRRSRSTAVAVVLLLLSAACTPPPPNLNPEATVAFQKLRVVKSLDLIRDTAQDANAQTPPLVSTDVARTITEWHLSALKIIDVADAGWRPIVERSLVEVFGKLPAATQQLLAPYFELAKVVVGNMPDREG